jgi:2-haloacid dehalogenase
MTIRAAIFDAYGTLLDVHTAMSRHAAVLGPRWQQISQDWRAKQLEYSWVRSLTGPSQHRDFWRLTTEALDWTLARHAVAEPALRQKLLDGYRVLDAYADVLPMLGALASAGIGRAILSNGEPGMLADAVASARIDRLLDAVLSVEEVGVFKPDPSVYRIATDWFGLGSAQLAFVSSNPWDAFAAREFGFQVFWINRAGIPDEYGLRGSVTELADLSTLAAAIAG